jgi:NAD(P)-dependent dehydrogenase (short-subunit alcohol dehydrogenase family)
MSNVLAANVALVTGGSRGIGAAEGASLFAMVSRSHAESGDRMSPTLVLVVDAAPPGARVRGKI